MKFKTRFVFLLLYSSLGLFFNACRNKVSITRNYIYNTNWDKGNYQGFNISKITLSDSSISVFDKNFNKYFLDKHQIDSSFCYHHFTGNEKYKSKTFFDRANSGVVWRKCNNLLDEKKVLGLLELKTWFKIAGLNGTEDFYVYIDSSGNSHSYGLGPTNF